MTSKISSVKLLRESAKRGTALAALLMLIFFCYYGIGLMALLPSGGYLMSAAEPQELFNDLYLYFGANPLMFAFTFGAAVLLGIVQFIYLHSREKLDFYHSFPVRRERHFAVQYCVGVLIWLAPFVLNLLLGILIVSMKGVMSGLLFQGIAKIVAANVVCFLLVYSLMILMMMVTGKTFAAIVGFGIVCAYAPAILMLVETMMSFYFDTYSPIRDLANDMAFQCTPVYAYVHINERMMQQIFPTDWVLASLMVAALLTGLGIFLYRMRGSETAGKTMAFGGLARVVKFLLVLPLTIITAMLFKELGMRNALWSIFGGIFGLLVFSAVIEFVYRLDIREIFRDKRQIIFTGVLAGAILFVFELDVFQYDRWLPAKTEVENVELDTTWWGSGMDSYRKEYAMWYTESGDYLCQVESMYDSQDNIKLTDLDKAYDLIEHSIEFAGPVTGDSVDYYPIFTFTFHMKDGTMKKRAYSYQSPALSEYFSPIWEMPEYKENYFPILGVEPEDVLDISVGEIDDYYEGFVLQDTAKALADTVAGAVLVSEEVFTEHSSYLYSGMEQLEMTAEQREELVETFQKELRAEKYTKQYQPSSLDKIHFVYKDRDGKLYGEEFVLTDTFEETIKLLEEYGYEPTEAQE